MYKNIYFEQVLTKCLFIFSFAFMFYNEAYRVCVSYKIFFNNICMDKKYKKRRYLFRYSPFLVQIFSKWKDYAASSSDFSSSAFGSGFLFPAFRASSISFTSRKVSRSECSFSLISKIVTSTSFPSV